MRRLLLDCFLTAMLFGCASGDPQNGAKAGSSSSTGAAATPAAPSAPPRVVTAPAFPVPPETPRASDPAGAPDADAAAEVSFAKAQRSAMVKGALPKEVILRIARTHAFELKACYERELAHRPDVKGLLTVSFTISGQGTVPKASVAKSAVASPMLEDCVVRTVEKWTFPAPADKRDVAVILPLEFKWNR